MTHGARTAVPFEDGDASCVFDLQPGNTTGGVHIFVHLQYIWCFPALYVSIFCTATASIIAAVACIIAF